LRQERGKTKIEPKQVGNWGIWSDKLGRFARLNTADDAPLRRFKTREEAMTWIAINLGLDTNFTAKQIPADYDTTGAGPATSANGELPVWYVSIIGRPGTEVMVRSNNHDNAVRAATQMRYDIFGNEQGNIRASTVPVSQAPGQNPSSTQFQQYDNTRGDLTPRGPGPWEIYRLSDGSSVRQLAHTDRPSAEVEARMALGFRAADPILFGVRTRQQAPAQPLGAGQELVGWTIKVGGQPVHTLSGIGNNQGDANRIAREWMLRQPAAFLRQHHGQEVEVVPEFRTA